AWGKASLLHRRLVRERRIAQDVVAYAFPIVVGASMLVLWSTALPDAGTEPLEVALFEEIEGLADVGDADVDRALRIMEVNHLRELQRVEERADQLSMFATLFNDPARINTELDRMKAVTPAHVRDF